jgi:hypothetical protein
MDCNIRRLSRISFPGTRPRAVVVHDLPFQLCFAFGRCDNLALVAHNGHMSVKTTAGSSESDLRSLERRSSSYGWQSAISHSDLPVGDATLRL